MIQELIDSAVILENLSASDKDAALSEVLEAMVAHDTIAKRMRATVAKKLEEREALGSTGIGNGVAVPHVKVDKLPRTTLALARSSEGLEWQAIDGRPVHAVFLLVAPAERAEDHLRALRWVSTLARNADFRRFLQAANTEAEIRDLLHEMSSAR